ncbi:CASTOR/POLLUX-related putative ion channel [Streptomyces hesseae]|uniref:Potassium transporter TrkA n=1 Tax=Streptomyces hesseae TaxID=3075519 RepID=A0ABU2SFC2_9ACTN|nr:potassium transporter TrkA [Streptomyces sp. DSM 40473]MDT0447677.1 potassium transporter TrkA [Streptomyces sp. DSM 40473]
MKWRERLRYWFDSTMDRGTPALIGWLAMASLALIGVTTVLVVTFTDEDTEANGGWAGVAWMSMLRTLDPGTMGGDTGGWAFLALMLMVTIGGIFIVSTLIGVLTTGLDHRIQQLRKGHSPIIESGHTVVLGWSEQVFTVVEELAEANQSQRRSCVVILADRDKVDMEEQIRLRVPDTRRTQVICRSGNPLKQADLELVSPDTAQAVVVLPSFSRDSDTRVIKVLLVLNNRPWAKKRPPLIAAVQDEGNLAAARLAAGPSGLVVDADDLAVRLTVQSHRQAGLSTVCNELLSFYGNEIYIAREPALTGVSYGDALHRYALGVPIGVARADGRILLNPAMDTLIGAEDDIILVAWDDEYIRLADEPPPIVEAAIARGTGRPPAPDRTLLIGWNSRAAKIIELLDRFARPDSTLDVASPACPAGFDDLVPERLRLGHRRCEPTNRRSLEALSPGGYQHILVLSDETVDPEEADNQTLVTLLHLRDIEVGLGDPYSIVSEMNNDSNREVAQVTKADDFIVSNKLICLLLTQLAENQRLYRVLRILLDPAGSEIYLKPADHYLVPGAEATFATAVEAARRRGETAIGYRLGRDRDTAPSYGVRLNPSRTEPLTLREGDQIVVLAEEG